MTYNIYQYDFTKIHPLLDKEKPDILVLQEIELTKYNNKNIDVPKFLEERLNYNSFEYQGLKSYGGVALLSKYPITKENATKLPYENIQFAKYLLEANIVSPQGNLTVYATHLDLPLNHDVQIDQVKSINQKINNEDNIVLLCDCNVPDQIIWKPYRLLAKEFHDGWILSNGNLLNRYTWPLPDPYLRIDYIWVKGGVKVLEGSFERVGNETLSDHYGIFGRITVN